MKRLLTTIALTGVLAGAALAGDMPTCGVAGPPAPETEGSIPTGDAAEPDIVAAILTVISIVA